MHKYNFTSLIYTPLMAHYLYESADDLSLHMNHVYCMFKMSPSAVTSIFSFLLSCFKNSSLEFLTVFGSSSPHATEKKGGHYLQVTHLFTVVKSHSDIPKRGK